MNRLQNNAICPIPWNHIAIQQNGDFRICCQHIHGPNYGKLSTKNNEVASIHNTTINDARNLNELKSLRKNMINGIQDPSCKLCYDEERHSNTSKRIYMLTDFKLDYNNITDINGSIDTNEVKLNYMDIRFGNLCNLKCRYCSPTDSSLWYEDTVKLSGKNSTVMNFYGSNVYEIKKTNNVWGVDSLDFEWYESELFWNQIIKIIPYVDRFYFTGGEPTINKTHFKLLQKIIDMGYAKNIKLEYNSNMFAIPEKLYDLWRHFNTIFLSCSIDGIGDMANYLRPPSKWDQLEKNLDYMGNHELKNIYGSINSTITVYNVLHIIDIAKWLIEKDYTNIDNLMSMHFATYPAEQSVKVLPNEFKKYVAEKYHEFLDYLKIKYTKNNRLFIEYQTKLNGILNFMNESNESSLLPYLKQMTENLDEIRGHDLKITIPWLWEILENVK